jgi:CHASE2 domain-containing sensor protein
MIKRALRGLGNGIMLTIFTFLMIGAAANIPLNLEFLNPIQNMFNDFDPTDIVFSRMRSDDVKTDERVVLVNFGNLSRGQVAEMIEVLNKYEPKVIGIDGFFRHPRDPMEDSLLAAALSKVKNLVMVSKFNNYNDKKKQYDTLERSNEMFIAKAHSGFANVTTKGSGNQEEFNTSRSIMPKAKVNGKIEPAFAVKVAELFAAEKAKKFLARNKETEFINFRGNVIPTGEKGEIGFIALNYDQILTGNADSVEFTPDVIKDKIVLLGFMGEKNYLEKSYVDKFYTPLNENYVGKSTLDMFGVVVHANIVAMILNEDYIDELSPIYEWMINISVCLISATLFSYFFRHLGFFYDAVTLIFQFAFSIGLLALTVFAFDWYNTKVSITVALLSVVLSGLIVEIYHGLIDKLFEFFSRKKELKTVTIENESK